MPRKSKKQPLAETEANYPDPPLSIPEKLAPDGPNPTTEWLEKNAHAKAIIMSTLIPGSEPWKIAEPLEYASDIWKALEDRYAPKNDPAGNRLERADFVNDWVEGRDMEKYRDGPKHGAMLTEFPADALNPEISSRFTNKQLEDAMQDRTAQGNFIQVITKMDEEKKALVEQRKKEANAAAAKVMADHMPNRDQRFLWALLHGGKEETMNWFNGTTSVANPT
jgi:hypothetical protein